MLYAPVATHRRRASATTEVVFWIAAAAAVLALMFYVRSPQGGGDMGANHPAVGEELSDVSLDALTGGGEKFTSDDFADRVTLINFWGTWCGPCKIEFPHIVELNKEFRDNADFQFVSISVRANNDESIEQLRANTEQFLEQHQTDFVTYVDKQRQTSNAVMSALSEQGMGVPLTLVVGPDGTLRAVWQGYATGLEKEMQTLLSELLAEKST